MRAELLRLIVMFILLVAVLGFDDYGVKDKTKAKLEEKFGEKFMEKLKKEFMPDYQKEVEKCPCETSPNEKLGSCQNNLKCLKDSCDTDADAREHIVAIESTNCDEKQSIVIACGFSIKKLLNAVLQVKASDRSRDTVDKTCLGKIPKEWTCENWKDKEKCLEEFVHDTFEGRCDSVFNSIGKGLCSGKSLNEVLSAENLKKLPPSSDYKPSSLFSTISAVILVLLAVY